MLKSMLSIRNLPDKADLALYWKEESRFPTIKLLAAKYLPILASSAPVGAHLVRLGRSFYLTGAGLLTLTSPG